MFRIKFLPVLVLLFTSLLILGQAKAQTPPSTDDGVPRKLVERLLNYFNFNDNVELLIGKLPEELPVELPMPDQSQIMASLLDSQQNLFIIIDAPESPKQIEAFYQKQLEDRGWRILPSYTNNYDNNYRGFVPSELSHDISLNFCKGNEGPLLSVNLTPVENAPTDVRLTLNSDYGSIVCEEQPYQPEPDPNYVEPPIPRLTPPFNSTVTFDGDGYYGDYSLSRARVETKLNRQALATHYEVQFKQAGWIRLEGEPDNSKAISLWTMKDQKGHSWLGVLSFTPVEGMPNQYSAEVKVWQL